MIFTSGTTGEPKAVLLANRTFFAVPDILQKEGLNWVTWVVGETTYCRCRRRTSVDCGGYLPA